MFKMSDLISWELNETLRREFDELENYASNQLYAFQHGDNIDIKLNRVGFISSDPGIIFDIQNVFSFTQKEIEAWITLFKDYGADSLSNSDLTLQQKHEIQKMFNNNNNINKSVLKNISNK